MHSQFSAHRTNLPIFVYYWHDVRRVPSVDTFLAKPQTWSYLQHQTTTGPNNIPQSSSASAAAAASAATAAGPARLTSTPLSETWMPRETRLGGTRGSRKGGDRGGGGVSISGPLKRLLDSWMKFPRRYREVTTNHKNALQKWRIKMY